MQKNIPLWKKISRTFALEQDAINYFNKNHKGRNDVKDFEVVPTNNGNFNLFVKTDEFYEKCNK